MFISKITELREKQALLALLLLFIWLFIALFFVLSQRQIRQPEIFQIGSLTDTAFIRLKATPATVNLNDTFTVDAYLDTNSTAIDGVDLMVKFNPSIVRLDSIQVCPSSTDPTQCFKTFAPVVDSASGQFDSQRVIDCANTGSYASGSCTQGMIEFGGVTFDYSIGPSGDLTAPVVGNNLHLATLNFTAIANGLVKFDIEYWADSQNCPSNNTNCHTVDSNVVTHTSSVVDDVLQSVQDAQVAVLTAGGSTICSVDPNDNIINAIEWMYILTNWGKENNWNLDPNDTIINAVEWMYVLQNWGVACT